MAEGAKDEAMGYKLWAMGEALIRACEDGDAAEAERLLDAGASMDAADDDGDTALMKAWPEDAGLQSGCAALVAALVAADHASPPGLASHYDFEAVTCACQAMQQHRSRLDVQWHGCAALHALALSVGAECLHRTDGGAPLSSVG